MTDKPKSETPENPPEETPPDYGGTDPVLTDEQFEALDRDGDGVVHLGAIRMLDPENPDLPPAVPAKGKGAAPENKDAAKLRDDKSDPEPTQLPADPKPIKGPVPPPKRGR